MANAIAMIQRCAQFGTYEGYQEYGAEHWDIPISPSLPEEEMGHGDKSIEAQVST